MNYEPFVISFKLAALTALILFCIALPLAWYLSQTKSRFKPFLEALTALPIVLPPSVLGFYLLWALSYNSPVGHFFEETFGVKLVFSFTGLVVASCFYSLPFMVQPLQNGLESINKICLKQATLQEKANFRLYLP